ncbi:MAG: alpha/beta hydrolase [Alphaproteobacteria bacterium]|nr:MAG: alpha/beta hydrolase [Alphaproteobacteria bacterium]
MADAYYKSNDGLDLFYRETPCEQALGLPVLCLPGLTRNSKDFLDLVPHLARQRRVLSLDFRGRGLSDWDPHYKNYQPMTYAQDVLTLCGHLGLERVVLIGTSLGGLVSMALAALKPDLIAGVVLNDIGPEIDPRGLQRINSYVGQAQPIGSWADAVREVKRVNEAAQPKRMDSFWPEYARRVCREGEDGVPRFDYDPKIGDASRETPPADPAALWGLYDALREIPTLAVRGSLSDLLSEETFAAMKARKPDLVQAEVPDVGHAPFLDEPEALEAIERFLSDVD